jgi:CO/xanthine dehydrogenase Mo-binding subunit
MTMSDVIGATAASRRSFLQATGAVVVSLGMPVALSTVLAVDAAHAQGTRPPLVPSELSSYIAINADGTATAFFGKMDMGHGLYVAIGQMVAEELDMPLNSVRVVMGDTATSVNQGGASGSTGIQYGGKQMRAAAAEARRVLMEMAAEKLAVPAEQLTIVDGIVRSRGDAAKRIGYGELIGGRYFNVQLAWNNKIGNLLYAPGKARPKAFTEHSIVGQPIKRQDIAPKVFAVEDFVTDIRLPGMLHGRMIRPPAAGSVPVSVDEASLRDIPGAKVVWQKDLLGIVAETEWDAVRAAERLRVAWSTAHPSFPGTAGIYGHIRKAAVRKREVVTDVGDVESAFAGAARVIEAEYQWPFQSHASMGPACAVVQIKDGELTCWTGSQKPHFVRDGVAAITGMPVERCRAIWVPGPGSYGRNDAGDAAMDAAVLAKAVGRPVRLQGMRHEGHGWDPKGPASIHRARAGLNAAGVIVAYDFVSKGFSRLDVMMNESRPADTLAGHFLGLPLLVNDAFGVPGEAYQFANKRAAWETIAPLLDRASPLRSAHLRDPVGPQIHFASESFIDELAAALNADPIAFRLAHLQSARDIAVIKAAAERARWQRALPGRRGQSGNTVTGRGFAYAQRNGTIVAIIADVDVDRPTGKVWARKFTVAHDCGQIINPDGLVKCIEGNIVQGVSRAVWEEVQFDSNAVTSTDWISYPILDIQEAPESIDVVLINRPEMEPSGAGEPSIRPVAAAIANAIFDATGVRIRQVPFSPDRVKAALS